MKFSIWIENRAADAVMGVIGADADEKDKVMGRKTTYFGSDIRSRLKGLGMVKSSGDYANIAKDIDDGITVGELIRRLKNQ